MDEKQLDTVTETTDGDKLSDSATLKERAVICLASLVYKEEALLSAALAYCKKNDNQMVSMEEYVSLNFGKLLATFPELQEEYINCVRSKNKKNKQARRKKRGNR